MVTHKNSIAEKADAVFLLKDGVSKKVSTIPKPFDPTQGFVTSMG
jgi:ABC-type lipoprotein export system ATPase subunit